MTEKLPSSRLPENRKNDVVKFQCPSCSASIKVKANKSSQSGKCPRCGEPIVVPSIQYDEQNSNQSDIQEERAPFGEKYAFGLEGKQIILICIFVLAWFVAVYANYDPVSRFKGNLSMIFFTTVFIGLVIAFIIGKDWWSEKLKNNILTSSVDDILSKIPEHFRKYITIAISLIFISWLLKPESTPSGSISSSSSSLRKNDSSVLIQDFKKDNPNNSFSSSKAMVRVIIYDDTSRRPLKYRSELWFRGNGSWYFKHPTKHGSAAKKLGKRKVGEIFEGNEGIILYPDGRKTDSEGRETGQIIIPFKMTRDMNPEGSDRDTIVIAISDNEISVMGPAIKAANGKPEVIYKRQ